MARGNPKPTLDEALSAAFRMLDEAQDGETVTVHDYHTEKKYVGRDEIEGLRRAAEDESNA
jgi:hypothetical protein